MSSAACIHNKVRSFSNVLLWIDGDNCLCLVGVWQHLLVCVMEDPQKMAVLQHRWMRQQLTPLTWSVADSVSRHILKSVLFELRYSYIHLVWTFLFVLLKLLNCLDQLQVEKGFFLSSLFCDGIIVNILLSCSVSKEPICSLVMMKWFSIRLLGITLKMNGLVRFYLSYLNGPVASSGTFPNCSFAAAPFSQYLVWLANERLWKQHTNLTI